jgi:hypothetical protein
MSEARTRQMRLQERILGQKPELPGNPRQLRAELCRTLITAHDEGLLRTAPAQVYQLVKLDDPKPTESVIVGGFKNFKRNPALPHFKRDDGAWFDFAITVEQKRRGALELVAYNFELRFPDGSHPAFIRLDLNDPGHSNEDHGLRCHLHPGNDDLQVPAPLLSPGEGAGHPSARPARRAQAQANRLNQRSARPRAGQSSGSPWMTPAPVGVA